MKKSFFLLVFLVLPISVFAWADTDRICADDTKNWRILETIIVNYPGESPHVTDVWKVYIQKPLELWIPELFYVVNIEWSGGISMPYVKRWELYKYHCKNKKATLVMSYDIKKEGVYMRVSAVNGRYIALQLGEPGMIESSIDEIIIFDRKSSKTLVQIRNVWIMPSFWTITGVVVGKNGYYLYLDDTSNDSYSDSTLFFIDKKTKKITKL